MLEIAAPLVKPGGRLVYATCSVLPEENGDQVAAFLANHSGLCDVALARGVGRRASAAIRPPRPTAATRRCSSRRLGTAPMASSSPCCDELDECCGCASCESWALRQGLLVHR